ncbi:MAG: hypothetical protein LBV51_02880 [Acholeplasmatales bacterium]|jgi:Na+-translocating ferredoxin:NAD+ oxidoreductase RNF subunit RnfB|nr:hypothetical protein [Acholeplasmatales bacterium]
MPKIDDIIGLLGGVDCGACGYPTCADCAEAIVSGEVDEEACVIVDGSNHEQIKKLLK